MSVVGQYPKLVHSDGAIGQGLSMPMPLEEVRNDYGFSSNDESVFSGNCFGPSTNQIIALRSQNYFKQCESGCCRASELGQRLKWTSDFLLILYAPIESGYKLY